MRQGLYPFQYEPESGEQVLTKIAGLPPYVEFAEASGLLASIEKYLHVRTQTTGWTDSQVVLSLLLLNIVGGESVSDIKILESDHGFTRIIRRTPTFYWSGDTQKISKRWPQGRVRTLPAESSIFRYIEKFHDPAQELLRQPEKAFIPQSNEHLRGLERAHRDFLSFVQKQSPQVTATLDMDALLIPTNKKEALYCYKGYKSYQPLNIWWAEQQIVAYTEFRDGNVPANFELLQVFHKTLSLLPQSVRKVELRSDSAGYQHDLLEYCELGSNPRFGRIEFVVACDVTPSFREAVLEVEESDWKPFLRESDGRYYKTNQEWAEVCYVPTRTCTTSKSPSYRFLALREPIQKGKKDKDELPFQVEEMGGKEYKLFGRVTNKKEIERPKKGEKSWNGNDVINWLNQRCGKDEESHSVLKKDFAGGRFPSGYFGANAAWWWIAVLSLNLSNAFKKLVLGEKWLPKRMKSIRFEFVHIAARVMKKGRQILAKLERNHPSVPLLLIARQRIVELCHDPFG